MLLKPISVPYYETAILVAKNLRKCNRLEKFYVVWISHEDNKGNNYRVYDKSILEKHKDDVIYETS